MEQFDFVIIGAGTAGEAAAHLAASRGASVAIIDRELFGGSCPFWACMPSKALLHAASVHASGGEYPWPKASAFRDYMINREGIDFPDDGGHARSLEEAGAKVIRGTAHIAGPSTVSVESDGRRDTLLATKAIVVAVGTNPTIPEIPGLDAIRPWTNREGTATRDLPQSLAILGGGPTAVELAQVYARYGVPVTIVDRNERLNHRDHPRNSEALERALVNDGVRIRKGVEARLVIPGGAGGPHCLELSDGSSLEVHEVLLAVGRTAPVDGLGLETVGAKIERGRPVVDDRLRAADGVFVVGDAAGPEMHTHLAHYQGEIAARIALGEDVRPDHRAIPRATYTDPETAGVGLRLDQAQQQGYDAFEETADLATSAKGYVTESFGHVSIVVDRRERVLLGAFIAGPGASEAIHEAVLAIKTRTALSVLADTIHAFPTTARVMGGLFGEAAKKSEG